MKEEEDRKKQDDLRLAEEESKKEDHENTHLSILQKLKAAEATFETLTDFDDIRKSENEQAIKSFRAHYKDCCMGKVDSRLTPYLEKKDQGKRSRNPSKNIVKFISDCEHFKRCVLDGEFDSIDSLLPWEHVALLDSLMMSGGSGGKPHISLQVPRRLLGDGEMNKVLELIQERGKLNSISLSNSSGWERAVQLNGRTVASEMDPELDLTYMERLLSILEKKSEDSTSDIHALCFEFVLPNDGDAKIHWDLLAKVLSRHENLELDTFKMSFKRRKTVISHNMMESHLDDEETVITELLQSLRSSKTLTSLGLRHCGLTESNILTLLSSMKHMDALRLLDVSENSIGPDGTIELAEHLKYSKNLIDFNIFGNNCQDEGTMAVLKSVIEHPKIQNLNIGMNDITTKCSEDIQNLLKTTKLREFSCSLNFLGRGIKSILKEVILNNSLVRLDLSYNNATESILPPLLEVLRKNSTLTDINFQGNQLPPISGSELRKIFKMHAKAKKDDKSAEKVKENSTLLHFGLFEGNFIPQNDIKNIEASLEDNRKNYGIDTYPYEPEKLAPKYKNGGKSKSKCLLS
eukprot:g8491.t1